MLLRFLMVCGFVVGGLLMADGARAAKPGKGVVGEVLAIDRADESSGTITVKVGLRKKKDAAAPATGEAKAFKVNKDTKFEKVSRKDGAKDSQLATFADVEKGARVRIRAKDDGAETVQIRVGKKKAAK